MTHIKTPTASSFYASPHTCGDTTTCADLLGSPQLLYPGICLYDIYTCPKFLACMCVIVFLIDCRIIHIIILMALDLTGRNMKQPQGKLVQCTVYVASCTVCLGV